MPEGWTKEMEDQYFAGLPVRDNRKTTFTGDFKAIYVEDWFDEDDDDEPEWIVPGLIPAGSLGFIASAPKRGKTWLALALALACALAKDWLGVQVFETVPTLYLALEGQRKRNKSRVSTLTRGFGVSPVDKPWNRLLRVTTRTEVPLLDLMDASWAAALVKDVLAHGERLVIIDVMRAAAPHLRETGEGAIDFAIIKRNLSQLIAEGVTVIFLHHFVKGSLADDRYAGELMTGSGALYGAMDFGIFIKPNDKENWGREMPLVFEMRDFEAPEPLLAKLEGEGCGLHGSLTRDDRGHIVVKDHSEKLTPAHQAMLTYLLGNPDGWHVTEDIRAGVQIGHSNFTSTLRQLVAMNLVEREKGVVVGRSDRAVGYRVLPAGRVRAGWACSEGQASTATPRPAHPERVAGGRVVDGDTFNPPADHTGDQLW